MNRQETPILHSKIGDSFRNLDQQTRAGQLSNSNISVTTYGADTSQIEEVFVQGQSLGLTPVRLSKIIQGMAWLMKTEDITMPDGRKQRYERGKITQAILDRVSFEIAQDNKLKAKIVMNDGTEEDILSDSIVGDDLDAGRKLMADQMVLGRTLQKVKDLAKVGRLLIVEENTPGQTQIDGPRILISSDLEKASPDMVRKADYVVTAKKPQGLRSGLLREAVRQSQIESRRKDLAQSLKERKIVTVPRFRLDNWPTDILMASSRQQVAAVVDSYILRNDILCDPQDLKYQTLFRLTTFDLPEVYSNGEELEDYLVEQGVYVNWRNIQNIDPGFVQNFRIRPNVLTQVIDEQYSIIRQRLRNSSLPLERIIRQSGLFAEPGWAIHKRDNSVFAAKEEGVTATSEFVSLEFREVDPNLAKQFHHDLHYIHTPRADLAFGLYMRGDDLPFSVLALEKIDRPYKQNTLLMNGYNPRFCYDLTRLYSRPGTPANTSSSMFSLAFNYMKSHYPETQAVLSAFMPSYASGVSMTSGGFDTPILIKPSVHTFVERDVDGVVSWEHLTKRRQEVAKGRKIRSKLPLLPTVELMSAFQAPRYKPLSDVKDFMVEVF